MNLNTLKHSVIFAVTIILLGMNTSCSKDADDPTDLCNASSYDERISVVTMAYSTALQTYVTDQTDANCQALGQAFDNYIDFLKEVQDCPFTVNGSDLNEIISSAEMDRSDLCN